MLKVIRNDRPPVMDEDDPIPSGDGEKERIEEIVRQLHNPKRRRWAYLKAARQARNTKSKLTGAEYRLLFALVEHASNDLSNCFPTMKTLAAVEGLSVIRIRKLLASVTEKGWLQSYHFKGPYGQAASGRQFVVPAGALAAWSPLWAGPVDYSNRHDADLYQPKSQ